MVVSELGRVNAETKAQNQRAIREAFSSILALDKLNPLPENSPFDGVYATAACVLSNRDFVAYYRQVPNYGEDFCMLHIYTGVFDPKHTIGPIARREYSFFDDDDQVAIHSNSATLRNFESQGIGGGLILVTNDVIADAVKRNPFLQNRRIVGTIIDVALAREETKKIKIIKNGIERTGWSSFYAEKLGFTLIDETEDDKVWTKIYHE